MSEPAGHTLRFVGHTLDRAAAQLRRGGRVIPLRPKTMACLFYLAENQGRLVTRTELLDAVWGDIAVSEGVLTGCVRELRHALSDDPRKPHIIETAHRQGYRFIAEVRVDGVRGLGVTELGEVEDTTRAAEPIALVGREAELSKLNAWLGHALNGARQIGFIAGEAGIGKTALVGHFLRRLEASESGRAAISPDSPVPSFPIAHGQCLEQHGGGEPYLPVLEALGRVCRSTAGEPLIRLLRRHAPSWLARLPGVLDAEEGEKLSHHTEPTTGERMMREMAALVEELSTPLILVLEDLHWSDYATVDLIARLAHGRGAAPLLVIGTYRPVEVALAEHPLKKVHQALRARGLCRELWIPALTMEAVTEYVRSRCPGLSSVEALAAVIHDRTDGNPLFVVNVVDRLTAEGSLVQVDGRWSTTVDADVVAASVPEGLCQMITTQIERLGEVDRGLLEVASVKGLSFSATVVAAALQTDLVEVESQLDHMAQRRHWIRAAGERSLPDATVSGRYEFVHSLYEDVLRDRVPPARRRQLHMRIAERLEQGHGDTAGEIAAELAFHFENGGDLERAVSYLEEGAGRAARIGANHDAGSLLQHGLDLLDYLPPKLERNLRIVRLCLALGLALQPPRGFANSESERLFARAHSLSEEMDDPVQLFQAVAARIGIYLTQGRFDRAGEMAERMAELMEHLPLPVFTFAGHIFIGMVHFHSGDLLEARTRLEQALAIEGIEQPAGSMDFYVLCLNYLAIALLHHGCPDQARKRIRQAVARAGSVGSPFDRGNAATFACFLHMNARDSEGLAQAAREATTVGREYGFPMPAAIGRFAGGRLHAEGGNYDVGIAAMREGIDAYRATGQKVSLTVLLLLLADAQARAGALEDALLLVAEARALVASTGEIRYEAEVYRLEGELRSARGERQAAQRCLRRAVDLARRQGVRWWELRASVGLALLLRQQRTRAAARRVLEPIAGSFREGLELPDVRAAHALLGELS